MAPETALRFGRFEFQPSRRRLLADGAPVTLGARAIDVLTVLVDGRGRVVSKSELMDAVWPRVVVEENNLAVQISTLRKVLGNAAIATVPGRGYRFTAADGGESAAGGPAAPQPAEPAERRMTNLPQVVPSLVGRDREMEELAAFLETRKLVTVVGAGGIGKSVLAMAVAAGQAGRWRDGSWWVELSGLSDGALASQAVASAIGMAALPRDEAPDRLCAALANREMLLVLDNCEHLLDEVARLVERIAGAAPMVQVLATSQEPLRVAGEQQLRLDPLPVPASADEPGARDFGAMALLAARLRSAGRGFELTDADLPFAVQLCRQLDGLPLAIELAAARVPVLGLKAVHDHLNERFRILTAGSRTALRRHQTLRAAMEWSHGLLDPGQQAIFRRLGAFSGGFTMELAQAVCAGDAMDEWQVLEHLGALVDKSLVVADVHDSPRYRLLESARSFALERLAAAGETDAVLERHARAMAGLLRQVDDRNMDGEMRTDQYAAILLPELDNLRAAYAWARSAGQARELAVDLGAHVGPLIDYSSEFVDWLLEQRGHVEEGGIDAPLVARFWRGVGASNMVGFLPAVQLRDAAARAAGLYRELAMPRRVVSSLRLQAAWSAVLGANEAALALLDEAEALLEPGWGPEFAITILRSRYYIAIEQGDAGTAAALSGRAVQMARASGDWRVEVIERTNHGDVLWRLERSREALGVLDDLMADMRMRKVSDYEVVDTSAQRIWVMAELGLLDEAAAAAREALPLLQRMPRYALRGCAFFLARLGRGEQAAAVLGAYAARERAGLEYRHIAEARLHRKCLELLSATYDAATLAGLQARGEGLGYAEVTAMLAESLANDGPRR